MHYSIKSQGWYLEPGLPLEKLVHIHHSLRQKACMLHPQKRYHMNSRTDQCSQFLSTPARASFQLLIYKELSAIGQQLLSCHSQSAVIGPLLSIRPMAALRKHRVPSTLISKSIICRSLLKYLTNIATGNPVNLQSSRILLEIDISCIDHFWQSGETVTYIPYAICPSIISLSDNSTILSKRCTTASMTVATRDFQGKVQGKVLFNLAHY